MKSPYLVLAIPVLFYIGAAFILEPGALLPMYPDGDLTAYLAADSLANEGNLDYTREDSNRFLREYGTRPAPFRLLQKKIMDSSGHFRSYYVLHQPELFVFVLTPFIAAFGFRGWLVLHVLLVVGIYIIGWLYYRGKDPEALSPAINSVVYFTLAGLPLLFLLPSHHLFLFAICTVSLFFGLKRMPIPSAIFLAIAVSSQWGAVIFAIFLIGYWQTTRTAGRDAGENRYPVPRFIVTLIAALFVVWGLEKLMYPAETNPRWITDGAHPPLAQIWNSLPDATRYGWTTPNGLRLLDFLFGRNSGFFAYAFVSAALLLSSIWLFRDSLIRTALIFIALFFTMVSGVHTSSWNAQSFTHDFAILLAPLPYFLIPLIRPKPLFIAVAIPAAFLAGPLLMNPLGAITNRSLYSYSFPYKYLPIEITLAGRSGITKDPEHQQKIPGGKVYFLNDAFYTEGDYFWLRGESTLEFLLELSSRKNLWMEFRNGVQENKITLMFGESREEIRLNTAERKAVDLSRYFGQAVTYEGKIYLHGQIRTNVGYVPGLLARDNPDYRFLSCQVQIMQGPLK